MHFLYNYVFLWLICFTCQIFVYFIQNNHWFTWNYLAKDWVLIIEIRSLLKSYKELTTIRFGTSICHTQYTWFIMSQFRMKLIFKRLTKDRLATSTSLSWIPSLQTKIFDKSMKLQPIVIAIFTKLNKILASLRH